MTIFMAPLGEPTRRDRIRGWLVSRWLRLTGQAGEWVELGVVDEGIGAGVMMGRCDACRRRRELDDLEVLWLPLAGFEDAFPDTRRNYTYCGDRPRCQERARVKFVESGQM